MHNDDHRNEKLGLYLAKDVRLSADWHELTTNLVSSALEFVVKGRADATYSSVSSIVKFLSSIRVSPSPGERAWTLVVLSFAWSLDQVSAQLSLDANELGQALRRAIDKAKGEAERTGVMLPLDFANRPAQTPLYKVLHKELVGAIFSEGDPLKASQISYKLDSAFNRAMFEIWSRKVEYYQPILEALNAPFALSAEMDLNWQSYRARLIHEFEVEPVFGQEDDKISLSQLYVPIRVTWKQRTDSQHISADKDSDPPTIEIAYLDDVFDSWLSENNGSDWLRLVGGGPGSGKSTSLKALARKLADYAEWRPLLIPLQKINLENDLREAINEYFVETTGSSFNQAPLSRAAVEDGPPLFLIFDGLDEIAAPGEAAREVVSTFANKLSALVSALDGNGKSPIKVVVSGRLPAFQAAKKFLTPVSGGALEAKGFLPDDFQSASSSNELWGVDQRERWWRQYSSLKGLDQKIPEAFSNARLSTITDEPLLCYLLALSGFAAHDWQLAADNRNRIYEVLINSVYDRGWGEGAIKRQGAGKSLTREDFHRLMETIALAAWLGGDARVATAQNFVRALEITDSEDAWETFTSENGADVTNLAMNFYLKSSDILQNGFEFTHKSFGEYLAARALFAVAAEASKEARRRIDNALRDWHRATKTGSFDREILNFLTDHARLRLSGDDPALGKSEILSLKDTFIGLAERVFDDGFPFDSDGSSWRAVESMQNNSECGVWIVINSCSTALAAAAMREESIVRLTWADKEGLSILIRRLILHTKTKIITSCLANIEIDNHSFSEFSADRLNLRGARLSNCVFARVDVDKGSFAGAELKNIRFYASRIRSVEFDAGHLSAMKLQDTQFSSCSINGGKKSKMLVSPLSLIRMGEEQISRLEGRLKLLTFSRLREDKINELIERRILLMKSLSSEVVDNLVPDWEDFTSIASLDVDDVHEDSEED